MARQGVRAEGHCKVRPGIEPRHRNGRTRKRPVSWKESDWVRVTHELRVAEGGTCQDTERKRQSEDSPVLTSSHRLETAEQATCQNDSDLAMGTRWGLQRKDFVGTQKESESEGGSPSRDRRGESEGIKRPSEGQRAWQQILWCGETGDNRGQLGNHR